MGKKIPFSPPDITREEIDEVVKVLESGWITSGPKVLEFEESMKKFCQSNYAVAVNSATAGMELLLKVLDIKEGDEVITTPYTYTATANVIVHRGIKPTFVDVEKDNFLIDIDAIEKAITPKTKVIMPVDYAGIPLDYDKLKNMLKRIGREDIITICDSAHSYGGTYKGKRVGAQCDFHVFSFHAVKNLTTAEGGGITFNDNNFKGKEDLHRELKITALHGQTKDALSKMKAGAWKYDIITDGFKCNMTDIMAAIGVVQMKRYESMIDHRRKVFEVYNNNLKDKEWAITPFSKNDIMESCYHLYPLRIKGFEEESRDKVIQTLADKDIATNVHFIPVPMLSLYKNLGYNVQDYPNAYNQYKNEISLPVYSTLALEDADYLIKELIKAVEELL
ncbi:DegT/DnrJ/EryC1/StrS aminotransferase family protein [Clostridium sp. MSJ-11]|uniref:DegT/DnrJ/EryC1/StrS aminotransferase family protein n=1 Tax=Clostridium mobile TaxID=2841512 RepID=A0ABS6EEU4_9CLOT|nr:DegT/DnrJ/EryC1/StrS aminotransferase family protein [Clostridium mobile]MBU5482995.1 DegT/DnrJ/EryC1/StrS aminotransferase family protein [Clostridium mobile]